MTHRYCIRCDCELQQPVEKFANYVVSEDFVVEEDREVAYAMVHTAKTQKKLEKLSKEIPDRDPQALAAEAARPGAPEKIEVPAGKEIVKNPDGSQVETAITKEIDFSIPEDEFEHVEVPTPDVVRDHDEVAHTYTTVEKRPVQKTGLVCRDCLDFDRDEVIWGPDKPEDDE